MCGRAGNSTEASRAVPAHNAVRAAHKKAPQAWPPSVSSKGLHTARWLGEGQQQQQQRPACAGRDSTAQRRQAPRSA
jgi:hypothetical protein